MYYVPYILLKDGVTQCCASCDTEFKHDPPTSKDVMEVADLIVEQQGGDCQVLILGWFQISEEGV